MKTKTWAFVVAVLVTSGTAQALTIMGNRSCGKWVELNEVEKKWGMAAAQSWLVGYLTGLAIESEQDVLADIDAPSIYLWTTNYCKANPLDNTQIAGYKLFLELSRKLKK